MGKTEAHRGRASQGHPAVSGNTSPGLQPHHLVLGFWVGRGHPESGAGSPPGSRSRAGHRGGDRGQNQKVMLLDGVFPP